MTWLYFMVYETMSFEGSAKSWLPVYTRMQTSIAEYFNPTPNVLLADVTSVRLMVLHF